MDTSLYSDRYVNNVILKKLISSNEDTSHIARYPHFKEILFQ